MGLTVKYRLRCRRTKDASAVALVRRMRELALDLPFDEVEEQITLSGSDCRLAGNEPDGIHWLKSLAQGGWRPKWLSGELLALQVCPVFFTGFAVLPAPGCRTS